VQSWLAALSTQHPSPGKWLIDQLTGNDGSPGEPDLDVDDPDFPADGVEDRVGDVVVTYGNWIMDTEHHNYFEIHPVRAWYLVARNSVGEAVLVDGNLQQEEFGYENFDITQVDDARRDSICAAIDGAEDGQGAVSSSAAHRQRFPTG
jgi:hypothetical protein